MSTPARRGGRAWRGQPLLALVLMLAGWIGIRATLLYDSPALSAAPVRASRQVPGIGSAHARLVGPAPAPPASAPAARPLMWQAGGAAVIPIPAPSPSAPLPLATPAPVVPPAEAVTRPAPHPAPHPAPMPVSVAGGHQLLWLAAAAAMPMPWAMTGNRPDGAKPAGAVATVGGAGNPPANPSAPQKAGFSHWSADGWVLLRGGGGTAIVPGAIASTYGASQLGAVLRYRLAPADPHRPSLYLRGTGALAGGRDEEVAFGASVRPIAGLPLTAMAEARVTRTNYGTHVRPAALVVTELPPARLPLGLRGEAYAQAGYVGGPFATGFVDAQARVDGRLFDLGTLPLRAGAGSWGGAQKGAARLDVGPSVSIGLRLGDTASARLAADWRFRVAGDARPSSGPALTLSAGM